MPYRHERITNRRVSSASGRAVRRVVGVVLFRHGHDPLETGIVESYEARREELIVHGVDLERFGRAIPYVLDSGQVAYGVMGIALALKTSRKGWVRGGVVVLLFSPVRKMAEKIYAFVADHRSSLPGSTCSLK